MITWVPEGQTVIEKHYSEVLIKLGEREREDEICGRTTHGFFTITTLQPTKLCL